MTIYLIQAVGLLLTLVLPMFFPERVELNAAYFLALSTGGPISFLALRGRDLELMNGAISTIRVDPIDIAITLSVLIVSVIWPAFSFLFYLFMISVLKRIIYAGVFRRNHFAGIQAVESLMSPAISISFVLVFNNWLFLLAVTAIIGYAAARVMTFELKKNVTGFWGSGLFIPLSQFLRQGIINFPTAYASAYSPATLATIRIVQSLFVGMMSLQGPANNSYRLRIVHEKIAQCGPLISCWFSVLLRAGLLLVLAYLVIVVLFVLELVPAAFLPIRQVLPVIVLCMGASLVIPPFGIAFTMHRRPGLAFWVTAASTAVTAAMFAGGMDLMSLLFVSQVIYLLTGLAAQTLLGAPKPDTTGGTG